MDQVEVAPEAGMALENSNFLNNGEIEMSLDDTEIRFSTKFRIFHAILAFVTALTMLGLMAAVMMVGKDFDSPHKSIIFYFEFLFYFLLMYALIKMIIAFSMMAYTGRGNFFLSHMGYSSGTSIHNFLLAQLLTAVTFTLIIIAAIVLIAKLSNYFYKST